MIVDNVTQTLKNMLSSKTFLISTFGILFGLALILAIISACFKRKRKKTQLTEDDEFQRLIKELLNEELKRDREEEKREREMDKKESREDRRNSRKKNKRTSSKENGGMKKERGDSKKKKGKKCKQSKSKGKNKNKQKRLRSDEEGENNISDGIKATKGMTKEDARGLMLESLLNAQSHGGSHLSSPLNLLYKNCGPECAAAIKQQSATYIIPQIEVYHRIPGTAPKINIPQSQVDALDNVSELDNLYK